MAILGVRTSVSRAGIAKGFPADWNVLFRILRPTKSYLSIEMGVAFMQLLVVRSAFLGSIPTVIDFHV